MRLAATLAAMAVVLACAGSASAQRSPYGYTGQTLPSERLSSSGFGGTTSASQFSTSYYRSPTGPLAVDPGVGALNRGGRYYPPNFSLGNYTPKMISGRLRRIESFALGERARFSRLQRSVLTVDEMLGEPLKVRPTDVSESYFQFIFPFGLRDKADVKGYGYGYYCVACLQHGVVPEPQEFLAEFTIDAQKGLTDDAYLKNVVAMLQTGAMPEGARLDDLTDIQLAAMGNILFNRSRYRPAAEVWKTLSARDTSSSLYAQAAGLCLFADRRFDEAASKLRRSLALSKGWGTPEFSVAGANLQNIFSDVDDLVQARQFLDAAIKDRPDDSSLQFLLAYINVFHGLWGRAADELKSLADKGDADAAKLLAALTGGRVAATMRRPLVTEGGLTTADIERLSPQIELSQEQRQTLVRSILDPSTFDDYMKRGDYYFFLGNYARATTAYDAAAKLRPDDPIARFAQGHAAFANGEYEMAAIYIRQGLMMEPDWGLYNFRMEEFYGDRENLDRRTGDLYHLVQISPENRDLLLVLGYAYYFDGRYEEAADILARAVGGSSNYGMATNLLRLAQLQS